MKHARSPSKSLRELMFTTTSVDNLPTGVEAFQPLLELHELETLIFDMSLEDFEDKTLGKWASAWPNLKTFELCSDGYFITLSGIIKLLQLCRDLKKLTLGFDASELYFIPEIPSTPSLCHYLKDWDISGTQVHQYTFNPVMDILRWVFLNLVDIKSRSDDVQDLPSEVLPHTLERVSRERPCQWWCGCFLALDGKYDRCILGIHIISYKGCHLQRLATWTRATFPSSFWISIFRPRTFQSGEKGKKKLNIIRMSSPLELKWNSPWNICHKVHGGKCSSPLPSKNKQGSLWCRWSRIVASSTVISFLIRATTQQSLLIQVTKDWWNDRLNTGSSYFTSLPIVPCWPQNSPAISFRQWFLSYRWKALPHLLKRFGAQVKSTMTRSWTQCLSFRS